MSYSTFIPKLWAAKILKNLNDKHIFKNLVTTEFQEPLKSQGNSIVINSVGRPTIKTYDRNAAIDAPEYLNGSEQTIDITEEKYFNFLIPSIDKVQAKAALMGSYTEEGAWALADTMDDFVADLISGSVSTANQLTGITAGTGASDDNLYEACVDLCVALDKTNTPDSGRWIVIDPSLKGLLLKDPRFVSFGTGDNRKTIRTGEFGQLLNATVWVSNNLPKSSTNPIMLAGYNGATAFVDQMRELEAFKPENQFGDALKELHVYGGKVIRPDNLARIVVTLA